MDIGLHRQVTLSPCDSVDELVEHARHAGSVTYEIGDRLVCRSCGYQPQNVGFKTISASQRVC